MITLARKWSFKFFLHESYSFIHGDLDRLFLPIKCNISFNYNSVKSANFFLAVTQSGDISYFSGI